jgi:hypothetical protein
VSLFEYFVSLWRNLRLAEGVGFEPTDPFGSPVFKTGALNRSAIPPKLRDHEANFGKAELCHRRSRSQREADFEVVRDSLVSKPNQAP